MWILILMMLNAPEGMKNWYPINDYRTLEACLHDRDYVIQQLKKEYPQDVFTAKCVPGRNNT